MLNRISTVKSRKQKSNDSSGSTFLCNAMWTDILHIKILSEQKYGTINLIHMRRRFLYAYKISFTMVLFLTKTNQFDGRERKKKEQQIIHSIHFMDKMTAIYILIELDRCWIIMAPTHLDKLFRNSVSTFSIFSLLLFLQIIFILLTSF